MSAQAAARRIASALNPEQAEVVLLRVLGGLDVDQVAAVMQKRPGTVRVLQHRALRRLAKEFSLDAMTPDRDCHGEMHRLPLGDDIAERLFSGELWSSDAPDSQAGIAALLDAATVPATLREVAHKSLVVAACVAEVRSSIPSTQQTIPGRNSMRSKILAAKVGAAATIAALPTAAARARRTAPAVIPTSTA